MTAAPPLSLPRLAALGLIAIATFHAAFATDSLAPLIAVALYCLCQLSRQGSSPRVCFYGGLGLAMCLYGPQLWFFAAIFSYAAVSVWILVAIWTAVFLLLMRVCNARFGWGVACLLAPVLWAGLEYFRSEIWHFRFSWLSVGYAFTAMPAFHFIGQFGLYTIGFVLMCLAATAAYRPRLGAFISIPLLCLLTGLCLLRDGTPKPAIATLSVAGIQLEGPFEPYEYSFVAKQLSAAMQQHPATPLFVLSEYTFKGPIPRVIRDLCRKNARYLIVGGEEPLADGSNYYNTAFVIGPDGNIVFKQVKSVPIQLFRDGLPAQKQELWQSPWGKIGICVCYDLSYRRVNDELVRQGAQAIIAPTMDVQTWGHYERRYLHGRVGPMRSAEYGIPVFRVCSSGLSQLTDRQGHVLAAAGYPGQGEVIVGDLELSAPGRIPVDRWLAPVCTLGTGGVVLVLIFLRWRNCKSPTANCKSPHQA